MEQCRCAHDACDTRWRKNVKDISSIVSVGLIEVSVQHWLHRLKNASQVVYLIWKSAFRLVNTQDQHHNPVVS